MRRLFGIAAAVTLLGMIHSVRADCHDSRSITLRRGAEVGRIDLDRVYEDDDSEFHFCLDTRGRQIDWYLAPTSSADFWFSNAQSFYASNPGSFYTVRPLAVSSLVGTRGFDDHFVEVSEQETRDADGYFTIILHASPDCTGNSSSCVVEVSADDYTLALGFLLLAILLPIAFCCFVVGLGIFCFFRWRRRRHQKAMYGPGAYHDPYLGQPQPQPYPGTAYPATVNGTNGMYAPQPQPQSTTPYATQPLGTATNQPVVAGKPGAHTYV